MAVRSTETPRIPPVLKVLTGEQRERIAQLDAQEQQILQANWRAARRD
ncbi:MAG: hypothetical protein R3B96_13415 [Pirellulaceae bacterium]